MKKLLLTLGAALLVWMLWILTPVNGTIVYQKESGKQCKSCHVKIPKKGEDPQLTPEGKEFQKTKKP